MTMTNTESAEKATHSYIARKACGCVVAVTLDDGTCADDVAGFIRAGYTVERMAIQLIPKLGCIHKPPPDPDLVPLKDAMGTVKKARRGKGRKR